MHYVEMYWLVYPTLLEHGASFSWIEPVTFLGIGGLSSGRSGDDLARNPLVPVNDPKLDGSINHVNPF